MDNSERLHKKTQAKAGTSIFQYPQRTIRKLEVSAGRVIAVEQSFAREVREITGKIEEELSINHTARMKLEDLKPILMSFSEYVKRIVYNMDNVSKIIEYSREGFNLAIVNTRSAMNAIKECSARMNSVHAITESVTKRIAAIAEFAVENKLIAINASVTASKAGEKVRGFKVIASEVSRLSAAMAEKVTAIIQEAGLIRERTNQILASLKKNIETAQHTLDEVDSAFSSLDTIKTTIRSRMHETSGMVNDKKRVEDTLGVFISILLELEHHVNNLTQKVHDCAVNIEKQKYSTENLQQFIPGMLSLSDRIEAAGGGSDSSPKILRMYEMPLYEYDPALSHLVREFHYAHFTCIRLVRFSTDRKIVPYLAESWNLDADGRTWHFRLKSDVNFFDGTLITADDVRFSIERLIHPSINSPYANMLGLLDGFDDFRSGKDEHLRGIEIQDEYTFDFVLKRPCNFFLSLLAHGFCSILKTNPVYSTKRFTRETIVSSGPFYSVPRKIDTIDLLAANPEFVNGRALLDGMEIHREEMDIVSAFIENKLDLAYSLPSSLEEELRDRNFRGEIRHYTSRYCYSIVVNFQHDTVVTRHPEIRRAIAEVIDKDGLLGDIYGRDVVPAYSPLSDDILKLKNPPLQYNPEQAKSVFASFSDELNTGEALTLAYVETPANYGVDILLERIREVLGECGLSIKLCVLKPEDARPEVYRNYDLVFIRFMPEIDPYAALEPFLNPTGGDNYFGYSNPALFDRLQDSIAIRDEEKRRLYLGDLLADFINDVFMIPLFFRRVLAVIPHYLREVFITPEESFVPDVVYMDSFSRANGSELKGVGSLATDVLDRMSDGLAVNERIKASGQKLTFTANEIVKMISSQKKITSKAQFVLMEFTGNVDKLKKTNTSTIETIRGMIQNTEMVVSKASFIRKSLESFLQELTAVIQDIQGIKKDIRSMFNVVKLIAEANGTIKSVAVNAAIIANKSDEATNDLIKVSQDISDLVETNAGETNAIVKELQGLEESMDTELAELYQAHDEIATAIRDIRNHSLSLEGLSPLLDSVTAYNRNLESINSELFMRIETANTAVDNIDKSAAELQNSAESLHFGLALESSVIEIIDDIMQMLNNICALFSEEASCK